MRASHPLGVIFYISIDCTAIDTRVCLTYSICFIYCIISNGFCANFVSSSVPQLESTNETLLKEGYNHNGYSTFHSLIYKSIINGIVKYWYLGIKKDGRMKNAKNANPLYHKMTDFLILEETHKRRKNSQLKAISMKLNLKPRNRKHRRKFGWFYS